MKVCNFFLVWSPNFESNVRTDSWGGVGCWLRCSVTLLGKNFRKNFWENLSQKWTRQGLTRQRLTHFSSCEHYQNASIFGEPLYITVTTHWVTRDKMSTERISYELMCFLFDILSIVTQSVLHSKQHLRMLGNVNFPTCELLTFLLDFSGWFLKNRVQDDCISRR